MRRALGDRRRSEGPPRLVLRFAVYTAIGLAVAGASILLFVRHFNTAQAERAATLHARFVADSILRDRLRPSDFLAPVTGPRRTELDQLFQRQVLVDGALRSELYDPEGRVTYSSDHALIGTVTQNFAQVREALGGTILSEVSTEGEEGSGKAGLKVLTAYVPVPVARGEPAGVMVLYQDYAPIARAAQKAFLPIAGVLEFVLVALYVTLVPMLRRVSNRVHRQMQEIEYQALHDELTDLPNRALFRDRIEQAILSAKRGGFVVAVMLIDLDRFKEINDTLGHQSGDDLLRDLGARLRGVLRQNETFARLGGDEFGVLLPKVSQASVGEVAERILAALEQPFVLQGLPLEIAASIGIALYPEHGQDVDTMIQRADVAMYVAKEARSGFAVYDAEHDPNDAVRLALAGELRGAMERGELVLHYQPKAVLSSGEIRGAEALVRWQHPERGFVPPDEFIPLAERTGLIKPLTRYVLEAALRQCRAWSLSGIELNVAVNVAMPNLLDFHFPDEISQLLTTWQVEPGRLELEITESTIMADPFRVRQVLTRLSEMGMRLAIDDFGTGYSSLAYLKRLPVDEIKIDKSFVMNMTSDQSDAMIVRSTIDLGQNLGLGVVAEGVETEETWKDLRAFGCDLAQGYYVSRPVPGEELAALLRARELPARLQQGSRIAQIGGRRSPSGSSDHRSEAGASA